MSVTARGVRKAVDCTMYKFERSKPGQCRQRKITLAVLLYCLYTVIRHHAKAFKIVERGGGALDEGLFSPSVSHEQGHIKTIYFGGGGVSLTLQRTTKNSLSRTGFELE